MKAQTPPVNLAGVLVSTGAAVNMYRTGACSGALQGIELALFSQPGECTKMEIIVDGFTVKGSEDEVARLLMRLRNHSPDAASLTPKQREVFDAVRKHAHGAHYNAIAEELNLDPGVVNARLNSIVNNYTGLLKRCGAGTFIVNP